MDGVYKQQDMVSFLFDLNKNMRELNKQTQMKNMRDNVDISMNIKTITQTIDGQQAREKQEEVSAMNEQMARFFTGPEVEQRVPIEP